MLRKFWLIAAACVLASAAPAPGAAQQTDTAALRRAAQQRSRQPLTQADVVDRLRRSGMSRAELRAELHRLGYDPALADPYYDALEQDRRPSRGAVSDEFAAALEELGLLTVPAPGRAGRAAADPSSELEPDSLRSDGMLSEEDWRLMERDSLADETIRGQPADSLPVFGRSVFRRGSGQFEQPAFGPVSPDYRLGPGDEVVLVLTGAVQLAYELTVGRDGAIIIPDVGRVHAAGLTLAQLEDRLYPALSDAFASVGQSARAHVSLGRARAIEVYVMGDVERPGAYQLSSLSTVLNALYRAGGPAQAGSFRSIEVRRGGNLVQRVDLYGYLLAGASQGDVRLEHGDIVFVPPVGAQVRIAGAVKRPAIYELLQGDGLRDALAFAGGPQADAALRRVQINRILPPTQRQPGLDRVLLDVDVARLLALESPDTPLQAGDEIRLLSIPDERRNLVTVTGAVRQPGAYGWVPGTTLSHVLERAEGLADGAYTGRALVYRLDPATRQRTLVHTPLPDNAGSSPDFALEDRDSVVVLSRESLRTPQYITLGGYVRKPGRYRLNEGMTLQDAILLAGGFADGAYQREAYVARVTNSAERSDTTARTLRVPLQSIAGGGGGQPAFAYGVEAPEWQPNGGEFVLRHRDRIEIRKAPGFEAPRRVTLTGEVALPGDYLLETRQQRLAEVLSQAGGLTDDAYEPGLQLVRRGDLLATDVQRALQDPESPANLVLEEGDSIHVPRYDPTVLITGAVASRTRVLYRPGDSLDDYIRRAGGYSDRADRGRVVVTYPDGERNVGSRFLFFRSEPKVLPGSRIVVPLKDERTGVNWSAIMAALSTTATLIVAVQQVRN